MVWRLEPARPTRVKVLDLASGVGVPKARLELLRWERSNQSSNHGDLRNRQTASWLTFAETDADGVALERAARRHELRIRDSVPGYGTMLLENIRGGQAEHVVKLPAPLKLAGRF